MEGVVRAEGAAHYVAAKLTAGGVLELFKRAAHLGHTLGRFLFYGEADDAHLNELTQLHQAVEVLALEYYAVDHGVYLSLIHI